MLYSVENIFFKMYHKHDNHTLILNTSKELYDQGYHVLYLILGYVYSRSCIDRFCMTCPSIGNLKIISGHV
jgi:hypothetical protein